MTGQLVAVYGSLKKGFYNHRGLGDDKEFLGRHSVRGVMYSNGSYPKLYHPQGKSKHPLGYSLARFHELEVYRISDARFNAITQMEIGAGYTPEVIDTEFGPATIYYMPHRNFYEGDTWVEAYTHDGLAAKFA